MQYQKFFNRLISNAGPSYFDQRNMHDYVDEFFRWYPPTPTGEAINKEHRMTKGEAIRAINLKSEDWANLTGHQVGVWAYMIRKPWSGKVLHFWPNELLYRVRPYNMVTHGVTVCGLASEERLSLIGGWDPANLSSMRKCKRCLKGLHSIAGLPLPEPVYVDCCNRCFYIKEVMPSMFLRDEDGEQLFVCVSCEDALKARA